VCRYLFFAADNNPSLCRCNPHSKRPSRLRAKPAAGKQLLYFTTRDKTMQEKFKDFVNIFSGKETG
jgi:hypothetical protein